MSEKLTVKRMTSFKDTSELADFRLNIKRIDLKILNAYMGLNSSRNQIYVDGVMNKIYEELPEELKEGPFDIDDIGNLNSLILDILKILITRFLNKTLHHPKHEIMLKNLDSYLKARTTIDELDPVRFNLALEFDYSEDVLYLFRSEDYVEPGLTELLNIYENIFKGEDCVRIKLIPKIPESLEYEIISLLKQHN